MQVKILKLPKHFTPEPSLRSNKNHLKQTLSKKIMKFSQAVYNKSLSPTYIDMLEKLKLRDESFDFEEPHPIRNPIKHNKFIKGRKMNPEGVKILNLPKLPFGRHLNYDEVDFSRKHFIENPEDSDIENFNSYKKQYRIQQKYLRKQKPGKVFSSSFKNDSKNLMVFETDAGNLNCLKHEPLIKSYDNEKSKFKLIATFREMDKSKDSGLESKKFRPKKQQISIDDIQEILKPSYKMNLSKRSLIFE
jgi:hypothetical protein